MPQRRCPVSDIFHMIQHFPHFFRDPPGSRVVFAAGRHADNDIPLSGNPRKVKIALAPVRADVDSDPALFTVVVNPVIHIVIIGRGENDVRPLQVPLLIFLLQKADFPMGGKFPTSGRQSGAITVSCGVNWLSVVILRRAILPAPNTISFFWDKSIKTGKKGYSPN